MKPNIQCHNKTMYVAPDKVLPNGSIIELKTSTMNLKTVKLKKGQRVHDTWYGNGVVVKVLKTGAWITLLGYSRSERYDQAHINAFIRKGWK